MGLDNYWVMPGTDKPFELPETDNFSVCGGMFSGNGCGSFRGKVYENYISPITKISLYRDRILNEDICKMAKALEKAEMPADFKGEHEQEWVDLVKMFRLYADAGAELVAWW